MQLEKVTPITLTFVGGGPDATGFAPETGLNWFFFRSFSLMIGCSGFFDGVAFVVGVGFFVATTLVTKAAFSI